MLHRLLTDQPRAPPQCNLSPACSARCGQGCWGCCTSKPTFDSSLTGGAPGPQWFPRYDKPRELKPHSSPLRRALGLQDSPLQSPSPNSPLSSWFCPLWGYVTCHLLLLLNLTHSPLPNQKLRNILLRLFSSIRSRTGTETGQAPWLVCSFPPLQPRHHHQQKLCPLPTSSHGLYLIPFLFPWGTPSSSLLSLRGCPICLDSILTPIHTRLVPSATEKQSFFPIHPDLPKSSRILCCPLGITRRKQNQTPGPQSPRSVGSVAKLPTGRRSALSTRH